MIVAVAIKDPSGKIWTKPPPHRHHHIIHWMIEEGIEPPIKSIWQGFITDEGIFLNRKDSAEHALKCKQIEEQQDTLISEQLW